jgi:hypothetical protein
MKILVYVLIVLAFTGWQVFAQKLPKIEPCKLTIEQLPKVRGLHLGMPFSEIKTKFTNLVTEAPNEMGVRIALLGDIKLSEFSEVRGIKFVFIDEELQELHIEYKSGADFRSIEEYTSKLSESLPIPKSAWVFAVDEDGGYAGAKCYGFDAIAGLFNKDAIRVATLKFENVNKMQTVLLRQYEKEKQDLKKKPGGTNNFKP